jgi:hypothetical protein
MNGINQEELDGVLGQAFACNPVPFEICDIIWNLVDLGKCIRCDLLYPKESMHGCGYFGYSTCSRCIPPHFCLSIYKRRQSIPQYVLFTRLLHFSVDNPGENAMSSCMRCITGPTSKSCVVVRFAKAKVGLIREALEMFREGRIGLVGPVGLEGMGFEYVEGVFAPRYETTDLCSGNQFHLMIH